jgi:histidinol-phosphate aminotransferase
LLKDYSCGILLDANENSLGSPASDVLSHDSLYSSLELNRYPDPLHLDLKREIGSYRGGIPPENIFLGVGSDEAIDILLRIFCAPREHAILITPPTYGMYKVCAKVNDVAVQTVLLRPDFSLDAEALLAAVDAQRTRLVFLCSPGNPTARQLPLDQLRHVAEQLLTARGGRTLLVVDEAYVDFCEAVGDESRAGGFPIASSATSLVTGAAALPNVVVLQTLSKAFGLAGIRLGLAVASRGVVQLMNNVKAPYNVNLLTAQTALAVFSSAPAVAGLRRRIAALLQERAYLRERLEALAPLVAHVFVSDANFLLFRVADAVDAAALYRRMADAHGVVCRFRGHEPLCRNCLRVTVGSRAQNDAFLAALAQAAQQLQPQPQSPPESAAAAL